MSWKGELGRRRRVLIADFVQGTWRYAEQAGTVTADTAAGRRFAAFGPRSLMAFPAGSVYGERWIVIGDATMLGAYRSPSAPAWRLAMTSALTRCSGWAAAA